MKVVVLVLVSVLASDAAAHCFGVDNSSHAELLHVEKTLPGGSGLVVQWGPRGLANPLAESRPAEDEKAWTLVAGTASVEFTRKGIAPGLFVLMPTTAPSGAVDVTDPSGEKRTITFNAEALPALLPAPRVASLKRSVSKGTRGEKKTIGTAKLRGDVPDDAVALVAYVGRDAVAWGNARFVEENGSIVVFHDAIPCWSQPNDAPAPKAGTKVQLAWLDKYGRLSKRVTIAMK